MISDYNTTFKNKKTNPISIVELQKQIKNEHLDKFDEIIVLGGKQYLLAVKIAYEDTGCRIFPPFEGLTIGRRLSALNESLKNY